MWPILTAYCSFPGITHISEEISRCCYHFRKVKSFTGSNKATTKQKIII